LLSLALNNNHPKIPGHSEHIFDSTQAPVIKTKCGRTYPEQLCIHRKNAIMNGFSGEVSDCCLTPNSAIVQLCHGENKLIFNEMLMMSALY
jgi:hypothetical protein